MKGARKMNKKLLGFITILLLFFKVTNVSAEANHTLTRWDYDNIYFVQDNLPDYYMSGSQFNLSLDGKAAFCVEPKMSIKKSEYSSLPLVQTNYSADTIDYLEKVIYYGYNYPNHQTDRYYIATQALIWEYVSPYTIEFYTQQYGYGDYIDVSYEKNIILNLVRKHNELPFFANKEYTYNPVSNLEFEDELLNNFEIKTSTYNDIEIDGNKLKINNLDNFTGKINISLIKKSYTTDESKYYYADGSQSLITGGKPKELEISLEININGSKLKINKLDRQSNLPIKDTNIIFNIKNIQTNEYVYINGTKDLYINEEGYLITPLLPFGTYEITEIKASDGYELNNDKKIVTIDDTSNGITIDIDIYNDKKKGIIEVKKYGEIFNYISFEYDFKELEDIKFELYAAEDIVTMDGIKHYSKDELVSIMKTDSDGLIIFDNLILGKYYIKEKYTNDNYIKDDRIYYFNLYENINPKIDVFNYLKKNDLKIKKVDSITKEPLNDTIFEIFIDDKSLGKFTTDEKGIIEIKNIPSLNYKIIEIKTKEGYALVDGEIYIDLNTNNEITIQNDKIVYVPDAMKNDYIKISILILFGLGIISFIYGKKKCY